MKIKPELEKQIQNLRRSMKDAYEYNLKEVPAPCLYFGAQSGKRKALRASCVNCRAERMVAFDNALADVDCYTLMIIDFLKACGVEVEDEG